MFTQFAWRQRAMHMEFVMRLHSAIATAILTSQIIVHHVSLTTMALIAQHVRKIYIYLRVCAWCLCGARVLCG